MTKQQGEQVVTAMHLLVKSHTNVQSLKDILQHMFQHTAALSSHQQQLLEALPSTVNAATTAAVPAATYAATTRIPPPI